MNEYLSVGETARALGLSIGEVLRLVVSGQLAQRCTAFDALPFTLVARGSIDEYQRQTA